MTHAGPQKVPLSGQTLPPEALEATHGEPKSTCTDFWGRPRPCPSIPGYPGVLGTRVCQGLPSPRHPHPRSHSIQN